MNPYIKTTDRKHYDETYKHPKYAPYPKYAQYDYNGDYDRYNRRGEYNRGKKRQDPSLKYIPPPVIRDYTGQVINTYIPGYGRKNVYVKGMGRQGMVELVILKPRDCISVHYSDLVGISPPNFRC